MGQFIDFEQLFLRDKLMKLFFILAKFKDYSLKLHSKIEERKIKCMFCKILETGNSKNVKII